MSGVPVTVVDSGGLGVTAVDSGAPLMTAVDAGGMAVTLVDSGGAPFVIEGLGVWADAQSFDITGEGDGVYRCTNWHGSVYSGPYTEDVEIVAHAIGNAQVVAWGVSIVDPGIVVTPGDFGQKYVDRCLQRAGDLHVYESADTGTTAAGAYTAGADQGLQGTSEWGVIYRYATGNFEIYKDGIFQSTYADQFPDNTPIWLHLHIVVPESAVAGAIATVIYAGPARS